MKESHHIYSKIPPIQEIDRFLEERDMKSGREIRDRVQTLLVEIRRDSDWLSDPDVTRESILNRIKSSLEQDSQELTPLINGTGAVIHTNLGRSVFSRAILDEVFDIAASYTNLEFSLETGKRGARLSNVGGLLKTLTGAEDIVVVNNNASAVLLSLITLAKDKEVIISRGELVEIGGSFRIPDIIKVSGATLREVGTTNRTRITDYQSEICDHTAVILKVHTSNYQITGFTESVATTELSRLARESGKIFMEDLGSGSLAEFSDPRLNTEPLVPQVLRDGVDVVTISGDKLLGGPQAGIILGRKRYLAKIKSHPLYRALRCDKITMLLLEKTLAAYARNKHREVVPTQRMLNEPSETVKLRAESVLSELDGKTFTLVQCFSTPGGGSMPGKSMPSWGIHINSSLSEDRILKRLRQCKPPIIARIMDTNVIIDCRTILPHQIPLLQEVLKAVDLKGE